MIWYCYICHDFTTYLRKSCRHGFHLLHVINLVIKCFCYFLDVFSKKTKQKNFKITLPSSTLKTFEFWALAKAKKATKISIFITQTFMAARRNHYSPPFCLENLMTWPKGEPRPGRVGPEFRTTRIFFVKIYARLQNFNYPISKALQWLAS